ncbi:hypothetical protein HRbin15_01547 [bacterium HR15]|nr:hypothetical protein HRbin15_01547 [bacterium HR15]
MRAMFRFARQVGLMGGLLALVLLGGCRRQPLSEKSVQESLAERREQYQTEIERGVQSAPPPIEVPTTQPSSSPRSQEQTPQGGGVPPYEAPPPTVGNNPTPSTTPANPADTHVGDVRLDPSTGQYGIAPPGAPEGYTIPLDNSASKPSSQ